MMIKQQWKCAAFPALANCEVGIRNELGLPVQPDIAVTQQPLHYLTCQIKDSEFDELSRQSSGYKHYAETIKRTSVYERDDAFLDTRRRAVQLRENATRARGIDTRMLGNDRREIQRLESERVSTRGKGSTLSAIERAKLRRVKKTSRTLARPTRRESKSGTATGTSGGTWRRTLGGGLNIEKQSEKRTKKKHNKLLEGGRRKRTSHKGDLSKIN